MSMAIVIRWYYNQRDTPRPVFPEMSAVFGPFADRATASEWADSQDKWGGWGDYQYQVEDLIAIEERSEDGKTQ